MDKIFIDGGGHNSCSARIFRKKYDKDCEYHIFSFEPEESFHKYYINIPNHTLIKKAIWTEDGTLEFWPDTEIRKAGGSLIKKVGNHRHPKKPITVETIDFTKWILENFSRTDIIDVKMDIEGAEYKVIPDMVRRGSFKIINKFFIEWHYYKIDMPEEKHKEIFRMVPVIKRNTWPGVENAEKILGKNYLTRILNGEDV